MEEQRVIFEEIGKRVLSSAVDAGKEVVIRLGRPRLHNETAEFRCDFLITGPGIDICRYAAGLDSHPAIQLAFVCIGGYLAHIAQEWEAPLRWEGDDTGFPEP